MNSYSFPRFYEKKMNVNSRKNGYGYLGDEPLSDMIMKEKMVEGYNEEKEGLNWQYEEKEEYVS